MSDSEQSSAEDANGSFYSDFDIDCLSEEDEASCDGGVIFTMSDVRKPLARMLSEETDRTVPVVVVEDEGEENDSWADLDVDTQVVPCRARDQQMKEIRRAKE
ncbi:hypothetical protein CPB97_003136, partial [Podila verticillata]